MLSYLMNFLEAIRGIWNWHRFGGGVFLKPAPIKLFSCPKIPIFYTFSLTGDNIGLTMEIWKSDKIQSKYAKNCWQSLVTISFVFLIPNRISRSKFWSHWWQKCYRYPFLGHFETPKECGRYCHRYLGKVIFFQVI